MEPPNSAENAETFEMIISKTLARLEMMNANFFHKVMTRSMATKVVQGPFAYSLEFPYDFLKEHGEKFGLDVTFQRPKCDRTWPIKLTVREFKGSKNRVFAYGPGGWKDFVMDNQIKVGDVLIFSVVAFSRILVHVGRTPEKEVYHDDEPWAKWLEKSSWWNPNEKPVPCKLCQCTPPCPRFVATVRPSSRPKHPVHHVYLEKELSLDVPGSFWERQRRMLKCDVLKLKGPNRAVMMVKAERTYHEDERKLRVRLESGWKAFLVANNLQVGDNLEFSLMGPSCFKVELLDRY